MVFTRIRGPASMCRVGWRYWFRIVLHGFQRDVRFQAVFVLIQPAHAIQSLADARLRHGLPGMDDPAAEFRGSQDNVGIEFHVAQGAPAW